MSPSWMGMDSLMTLGAQPVDVIQMIVQGILILVMLLHPFSFGPMATTAGTVFGDSGIELCGSAPTRVRLSTPSLIVGIKHTRQFCNNLGLGPRHASGRFSVSEFHSSSAEPERKSGWVHVQPRGNVSNAVALYIQVIKDVYLSRCQVHSSHTTRITRSGWIL